MISYSLYLFHFITPGIVVADTFSVFEGAGSYYYLLNFGMSFLLAVALAAGIYRLVEFPARQKIRLLADGALGLPRLGARIA
jgi:peptidoglycan/LPS O-acetylase OafA/YrhL